LKTVCAAKTSTISNFLTTLNGSLTVMVYFFKQKKYLMFRFWLRFKKKWRKAFACEVR
jgi:hypothetical protein